MEDSHKVQFTNLQCEQQAKHKRCVDENYYRSPETLAEASAEDGYWRPWMSWLFFASVTAALLFSGTLSRWLFGR